MTESDKYLSEIMNRYSRLLEFVKELADESVYERYENLNEMNWSAFELLKEINEL